MNLRWWAWALVWALCCGPVRAQDIEDIFARARRVNPTLADLKASLHLELRAQMGPLQDHPQLSGTYYYKREGQHKLDLPEAPSYLKNQPGVLGFSLPRLDRYQGRVVEKGERDGRPVWKLELTPRKPGGSIERIVLWIHCQDYTVARYDTFYAKEGRLSVSLSYTKLQGYLVFDRVHADFEFPAVLLKATAEARYRDYAFNQGLSDSFFLAHPSPEGSP